MILKAGTYRFNDYVSIPSEFLPPSEDYLIHIPFTWNLNILGGDYVLNCHSIGFSNYVVNSVEVDEVVFYFESIIIDGLGEVDSYNAYVRDVTGQSAEFGGWNNFSGGGVSYTPYITFNNDVEISETNGTWVISSTDYNEVNAPSYLAEITYNGETIAQLNAGETATLSCKDKKMVSDVVVKVNEVESKIPEGYVKPEGTLELTVNNVETAFPIDCSQYANVVVNTAEPLKVTDPTVLDNITDSPWGVGGSVFLYEGATTDSYENGALYYLEDTEK